MTQNKSTSNAPKSKPQPQHQQAGAHADQAGKGQKDSSKLQGSGDPKSTDQNAQHRNGTAQHK